MKPILRDYQKAAIEKILWGLTLEGTSIAVLPTGAGKSIVLAELAAQLNQDILILQPSKEILEQNYSKLCQYVDPDEIGIYSASMKQKVIKRYTFATIGSVYKKADDFKHFKIVLIDECHLVNPKNLSGMFTKFLKEMGSPKVLGVTATPYRMGMAYTYDKGLLTAHCSIKLINRVKPMFWNRIVFNINNHELVDQKYLVPLKYLDLTLIKQEDIPINKSESDFDLIKYEKKISGRTKDIINTIRYAESVSNSTLVFCSSVSQAVSLKDLIKGSSVVTALTPAKERENIIKGFKSGEIKTVFNVGVLTTGFDHPALDCIVLLRPTRSIALYYQMIGRGVRISPGKEFCRVIDMTNTVEKLGRIETIKLEKIDNKWELISETGSWHAQPLYSFTITK